MSRLSSGKQRSARLHGSAVSACFCSDCSRVLYVADPDLLFCPVCSSPVTRIEAEAPADVQQTPHSTS